MGQLKHRLLFVGLSISAYASPLLMIFSLFTNYWLHSIEKISGNQSFRDKILMSTTKIVTILAKNVFTNSNNSKNVNFYYTQLDYIDASYGLWRTCKISDTSNQTKCEYTKYFYSTDSENRVTDTLKKQIGICITPLLISILIMIISVLLHTYAFFKKKQNYLFLLSGCLFIFAGLASLTALILFIAAVNGAVDSKSSNKSKEEEEPQFRYNYGFSFFCCVCSFLLQEFNGICNIYWYIDYYRKYRYDKSCKSNNTRSFPQIPLIKINDSHSKPEAENNFFNKIIVTEPQPKRSDIKIITEQEQASLKSFSSGSTKRPSVNRRHKLNHQLYKSSYVKKNALSPIKDYEDPKNIDSSSITSIISSSSSSSLTSSLKSSLVSSDCKPNPKIIDLNKENDLKLKFYKLDKELLLNKNNNLVKNSQTLNLSHSKKLNNIKKFSTIDYKNFSQKQKQNTFKQKAKIFYYSQDNSEQNQFSNKLIPTCSIEFNNAHDIIRPIKLAMKNASDAAAIAAISYINQPVNYETNFSIIKNDNLNRPVFQRNNTYHPVTKYVYQEDDYDDDDHNHDEQLSYAQFKTSNLKRTTSV